VRFPTTHDKGNVFAVRLVLAHGKGNEQVNGANVVHACGVVDKSTWKRFVSSSQYNPFDTYTRHVLAAPPKKNTRSSFSHGLNFTALNSTFLSEQTSHQQTTSSTFLSEQTSHQQTTNSTFLSEQISTSHHPPAKRYGVPFMLILVTV
jgi:hypothetical protein